MAVRDIKAEVDSTDSVEDAALALLKGVKQALDDALQSGDIAKVEDVSDDLADHADELALAVAAKVPTP